MEFRETEQKMMHSRLTALKNIDSSNVPFYFSTRHMAMVNRDRNSSKNGKWDEFSPIELALLTIQENGCAPDGFGVITEKSKVEMPFYVAGYDFSNRQLVIGTGVDKSDNLLYGLGKLDIANLVGYETIEDLRIGALRKLEELRRTPITLS